MKVISQIPIRIYVYIAIISFLLTLVIRYSSVDIGVDVSGSGNTTPYVYTSIDQQYTPLQRIDPRYILTEYTGQQTIERYYGTVPRYALSSLQVLLHNLDVTQIERIYVGRIIPVIVTSNPGSHSWGWIIHPGQLTANLTIPYPVLSKIDAGGFITFLLINLLLVLLSVSSVLGFTYTLWFIRSVCQSPTLYQLKPFSWKLYLSFLFPPLIIWGIMLLAFYPGCMSSDSFSQWRQAMWVMRFVDHHPALNAILMRVLLSVWKSPAIICLFQIVLLSSVLAYAMTSLYRAGINRSLLIVLYITTVCSPQIANFAIVIWKDVNYTIAIGLFMAMTLHMRLHPKLTESKTFMIALGFALGLIPLFRHNGLIIVLPFFLIYAVQYVYGMKKIIWAMGSCLFILLLVKGVLFSVMNVQPIPSRAGYMAVARISIMVDQDVPFSQHEYAFLERIRPFDDRWHYLRYTASRTIFNPRYQNAYAVEHAGSLADLHTSLIWRYPYLYFRSLYETTSSFYSPFPPNEDDLYIIHWLQISQNDLNLKMQSKLPWLKRIIEKLYNKYDDGVLRYILWRPGYLFALVLIAAGVIIYRHRNPHLLLVYLPVILNTISLMIAAVAQDTRYQLPLTFTFCILFALAFLPKIQDITNQSNGGYTNRL